MAERDPCAKCNVILKENKMGKIKILLSGNVRLQYYVDAVEAAGAVAVAKYLPEIDTDYDGLILCGGNDINPKYYNEEINGSVNIDHERDAVEFELLKAYIDAGKPVLGICRGFQLINAFFGGSLYQHIPESQLHVRGALGDAVHAVSAIPCSVISSLYGAEFAVNSAHHQAVKTLGEELCATAYWNGKYIEAFEHKELAIFGVQWHPERTCGDCARADTVDGAKIFRHFVSVCENSKEKRYAEALKCKKREMEE